MPGAGPYYLTEAVDGTEVALRLLHGNWTRDAAARDRFTAEAGAARRVPPYCAARILDAGVENEEAYLVSEYVAGRSLLEVISDTGGLAAAELEALALGSAAGLASVHQAGLVHGGFGPEHVIMSAAGPRIIEFGITPPYGPATPSADMQAWAQTMVFAATGRPPAALTDLDLLPDPLREAVTGCLAGDPALRPTARSIVLDLLDDPDPPGGPLATAARRVAQAAQDAAYAAEAEPGRPGRAGHAAGGRSGRGGRSGQGGRSGPQPRQRQAADGERDPRGSRGSRSAAADRPASRAPGRRGALPIVAAVVVIVAIAVVLVHVVQNAGGGRPQAQAEQLKTPDPRSTSPVSSTLAPPASPATLVPASFAGSWSGQARQVNPSDVFDVRLTLTSGASGGTIAYSSASFSCSGALTLQSSKQGQLTLDQGIVTGQSTCANGKVTLSVNPGGTLRFRFRGKSGPAASGTLARK
jgi:hypothetical protein